MSRLPERQSGNRNEENLTLHSDQEQEIPTAERVYKICSVPNDWMFPGEQGELPSKLMKMK